MPSYGRVFSSSAAMTATMHPYITSPRWTKEGAFFGYDMRTGRVLLMDFQLLMRLRILHSAVVLVIGAKDHGKSALVKSLVLRLLAMQVGLDTTGYPIEARARLHDRKPNNVLGQKKQGEWNAITDFLMCDIIELAKFGFINPFDYLMDLDELDVLSIALTIATMLKEEKLAPDETLVHMVAVHRMLKTPELASPEMLMAILRKLDRTDVTDYFDSVNDEIRQRLEAKVADRPELKEAVAQLHSRPDNLYEAALAALQAVASHAAATWNRLTFADYGNVFGAGNSLREVLSSPMANIDWTGVPAKAVALLEYLMTIWDSYALDHNIQDIVPHLEVRDEEGSALKHLPHARARDEIVRKARAYNKTDLMITQYITDLTNVGEAGSELRDLGRSINKGVGVSFIGKQPSDDETMHELTQRGISDEDAWQTTTLEVGCWGIFIPDQPMVFAQHALLPSEIPLIESNNANKAATDRTAATSFPHIQRRLNELNHVERAMDQRGAVLLGVD